LDVLGAETISTAGDYARLARQTIAEISARGVLPIVAGGTGFYLRALLDGLPALPPRDLDLRQTIASHEARRPGSTHRLLRRFDAAAAQRIHASDIQKLTRALEICLLTRRTLPAPAGADPLTGYHILQLGLDPPRVQLVQAIAARTRQMFDAGLIDEVRALLAGGLTGQEKPFESLGYQQALAYLRGETTLPAAIESTEIETRQYAKRQRTWFRRDSRIRWLGGFGTELSIQHAAQELVDGMIA
jgi:tRNA dimethylallyltransferase